MLLSISSSELISEERTQRVSTPIPRRLERPVPAISWLRMLVVVAATTLLLMVVWEAEMRHLGLRAGDLGDEYGYWAAERRKVDAGPRDSVVLIGDSRMLFDTDLGTWQRLTGGRPIQLGLMGANAQPMLHDLAADTHFAGLLVIGTAEFSYFGHQGRAASVLRYIKNESPSQRSGTQLYKELSRYFAFLDSNYTLFNLLERPYMSVWKVGESYDDRQSYLWEQITRDDYLREHAKAVWVKMFAGPVLTKGQIEQVVANTKPDVDRIRARGGEVVWIRPPSSGPLLDLERSRFPRQEVWDRLMRETASFGVHFEDYPAMQYPCADWSHLPKPSAIAFTDAYVRVLRDHVSWLQAHSASPQNPQQESQ